MLEILLEKLSLSEAREFVKDNNFSEHGMRPKIFAAIFYLEKKPKGRVVITKVQTIWDALRGKTGDKNSLIAFLDKFLENIFDIKSVKSHNYIL